MVSLRRRKLLGLCSGKSSFLAPHPKFFDHGPLPENPSHSTQLVRAHPMSSDDIYQIEGGCSVNVGPRSSNASGSISSKEQDGKLLPGTPIKRRKRHRRKQFQNQEPCLMRGVYFKNMKWQAAIKVDKKQIHLGTVVSQEEAAHLYDRAAFMCGREPNFELSEEEKQELRKFKWEDFLAMTRCAITNKKHKRRHHGSGLPKILPEPSSLQNDESEEDLKQGLNHVLLASEEEEIDKSVSK